MEESPHFKLPLKREPCREQVMLVARLPEPFHQLQIPAQCLCNETLGVAKRVFGDMTEMHKFASIVMRLTIKKLVVSAPRYDAQTLLLHCPDGKRKQYATALDSLLEAPLQRQDRNVKAFVKMERLELLKPDKFKEPRIIQARAPRFNVELGQYTRPIENSLKSLRDPQWQEKGVSVKVIAKGDNLHQRAVNLERIWQLYEQPVALALDLSRWDMRVSKEMLEILSEFYLMMFPDPHLASLLDSLTDSRCKTTKGVKYSKKHGITSGDMTTALGNCVAVLAINWGLRDLADHCVEGGGRRSSPELLRHLTESCLECALPTKRKQDCTRCYLVEKLRAIATVAKANQLHHNPMWTIYDDGDDHVLICDRRIAAQLQDILPMWWDMNGHKLTIENVVEDVDQIMFCQMKMLRTIKVMVPDPRKTIATSLCLTGRWRHEWRAYLKTMWKARAIMHQGVPVLGPLFFRLQRDLRGPLLNEKEVRRALMRQDYWLRISEGQLLHEELVLVKPTSEARLWMQKVYQIDVETQLQWENLKVKEPRIDHHFLDLWNHMERV